jgi:S-adenosylmethionine-diacylgycerolhomoserine-N-methlytransferase
VTVTAPQGRVLRRYGWLAPLYELTLGDRLLYAGPRRRAVDLLRLAPGATVVDFTCGTGLNFPLLQRRIGPTGTLVGVDLTTAMLDQARARVRRAGWANVHLVRADVTTLTRDELERAGALRPDQPVDAVLCTLGMSVVPRWQAAWDAMLALVRPGGTAALMDGGPPPHPTLVGRAAWPLVWLGCRWFAADWTRRPWRLAERDLPDAEVTFSYWGWIHAAGGRTRT